MLRTMAAGFYVHSQLTCLLISCCAAPLPPLQTRDGMKWEGPLGAPPLLVKIAPDLTRDDMEGACARCCACCAMPHFG